MANPTRSALPSTARGTNLGAFGSTEWGLLVGVAIIWGSSFFLMAVGLEAFEPGVVTLARVGLGAAALALIKRARTPIERGDMWRVAVLGMIWVAIPLTLFPIAQLWIDSSVTAMLNAAMPVAAAFWATVLMRKAPGTIQLVGILVGLLGIIAVSLPELRGSSATATGVALSLVAVALYGLSANLAVPLQQKYGALPVLFRALLVATVAVLPMGIYQLGESTWSWKAALAMVPLGVLSTGLAFVLMSILVGRVGAPRGAISIYFVPVVAIILGVLFLDEVIEPIALVGVVLVLAGAWIASRAERA
ncbi:MAG: DMT family transporter [bacterium]|nr:DMT family transporter [bacterium]